MCVLMQTLKLFFGADVMFSHTAVCLMIADGHSHHFMFFSVILLFSVADVVL